MTRPDILFIMTDQQRFDTIAALGNSHIYTPNMDRLVRRGISFSNAYATCPVCVAARYTIRTGCEPATTRVFTNCGVAKKLTIRQIAKAMTTVRGLRGSIRSSISSSNPWANGLRCFTFRNAARFQRI